MPGDSVSGNDGIGNEGVRGVHTRQQDGRDNTIFQDEYVAEKAQDDRNDKGEYPKYDGFAPYSRKIFHVHFQAG